MSLIKMFYLFLELFAYSGRSNARNVSFKPCFPSAIVVETEFGIRGLKTSFHLGISSSRTAKKMKNEPKNKATLSKAGHLQS